MTQTRDSHGRFKADHHRRNLAIGTATAVGAVASAIGAALHFGLFDRLLAGGTGSDGHPVPDLEGDRHPGPADRAPEHFRPDPTAAVPAADREALRPAPPLESAADAVRASDRQEAY